MHNWPLKSPNCETGSWKVLPQPRLEGWTPERNAEHQKRSDKMAAVQLELQATAER